jgi:hypothetical protein
MGRMCTRRTSTHENTPELQQELRNPREDEAAWWAGEPAMT